MGEFVHWMARKMEEKLEPLDKKEKKKIDISIDKLKKKPDTSFLTTKGLKKFWYS
jgi:hypothetical protein